MRFFLLLLLLFNIQFYSAQYSSFWYNTENALKQNSIKDIIKDKYGFLWLSTENGVLKYDGNDFVNFSDFDINNVHFGDFSGDIGKDSIFCWNDNAENAVLINSRKVKVYPYSKSKSNNNILSINNKRYKLIYKSFFNNKIFTDINYFIELKYGTYFFENNKIIYIDRKTKKETVIKINFKLNDLNNIFCHGETLFIPDTKARKKYKIEKGKLSVSGRPSIYNDPKSIIYWSKLNNQVFVINNSNIYLSSYIGGQLILKHIIHYKEIGNSSYTSMYFDQMYNKLYLGSSTKGLNVLNISNFFAVKQTIPFADNVYYASLPYNKNSIITDGGLVLNKYGIIKDNKFEQYPDKLIMAYDNSNNILYLKDFKLKRHSLRDTLKKNDSADSFTKNITGICKSNGMYILMSRSSSKRYDIVSIFKDDQFTSPIKQYKFYNSIYSCTFYNNKNLLVGCNNGLFKISLNDNKIFKLKENISVKQILKTSEGNFWIITSCKGFYLLKNDKLIKMPVDKDRFLSCVHYFLEDRTGYLWISSNNGLFKVLKSNLLKYSENQKTAVQYYRYDKNDGFNNNEFNGGSIPAGNILENGEFVFPSMDGFVFFNPAKVKSFYPNPQSIYIERAKIDDLEILLKHDSLNLESDYKNGQVYIDIPYFGNNANLTIEAKLSRKSIRWEAVIDNKYFINNLDPGNYVLTIRVLISPDGRFFYKSLNLTVIPKFYQTFLFKITILLMIFLIILGIIKIRTNFLSSKNQSLKKIVVEKNNSLIKTSQNLAKTQKALENETEYQRKIIETIGHDILTPIKYLSNLSKNLYETDDIELQKKFFNSIYKSSEELYKFTLDLKEYSNLYRDEKRSEDESYKIFEIIDIKMKLFGEIALSNNTIICNIVNKEITTNVNKITFSAIIHNLLDNAVKNTQNGKIIIDSQTDNESIIIRISDSGKGISQEQIDYYKNIFESIDKRYIPSKNNGLGLHMVFHFVTKICAQISLKKNDPVGTTVEITINKN